MKCVFAVFFWATAALAQPELTLIPIASGLEQPLGIVSAGDSRLMEGDHSFNPSADRMQDNFVMPVIEYGHIAGACSITGGYRYRGPRYPFLW